MRLTDLQEARRLANERWISEDDMDIKIRAACFNKSSRIREFWEYYHDRLMRDVTEDRKGAHQFLSDLDFRRKAHVNAMNKTLEYWDARFRVSDMRWTSGREQTPGPYGEAGVEWKVLE